MQLIMVTETNCPNCQKLVEWNDKFPYRPFCSHRCRLIDLGEWASEGYRIPEGETGEGKDKPITENLQISDINQTSTF